MNTDQLRELIRELIKSEIDEANVTGTGTTVSAGSGEAYATPHAFGNNKRKKKKGYMGYKEIK